MCMRASKEKMRAVFEKQPDGGLPDIATTTVYKLDYYNKLQVNSKRGISLLGLEARNFHKLSVFVNRSIPGNIQILFS